MSKELKSTFIERDKLYEKMQRYVANYKVTFVCAPAGYGKTVTARRWLIRENKKFEFLSVFDENFIEKTKIIQNKRNLIVVIDDLHALTDPEDIAHMMNLIVKSTCKFIILSRIDLPAYLRVYHNTNQIGIISQDDMAMRADEISQMLEAISGKTDKRAAREVQRITKGWSVAVDFLGQRMLIEGPNTKLKTLVFQVKKDLYEYLDLNIYSNWDRTVQVFLLSLSLFDEFTSEMAVVVTGKKNAEIYLKKLSDFGKFLLFSPPDKFYFAPFFKEFLDDKRKELMSEEKTKYLLENAGLYYELENDYATAMKYYDMADDMDKLSELLIENSKKNAVEAQFFYTEKYYRRLPKDIILQSPIFMSTMAMLESMRFRPEESEKWYDCLVEYKNNIGKSNMNYKLARDKINYLDIALPHRESTNVVELVINVAKSLTGGSSVFQDVAITGNLPSILNGGKDLTGYAKNAAKITKIIKKPGEIVFGKYTIGLPDAAVAESLYIFSTNLNFADCLRRLNVALSEASVRGTIQSQFCIVGIMAQVYMVEGSIDAAVNLMENFKEQCIEGKYNFLLRNIESILIRLALNMGKTEEIERWMESDAPQETKGFILPRRHQYLTKVRCYITQFRYAEAISLLAQLQLYYESYKKPYGALESKILYSILLYRMGDQRWKEEFEEVVTECSKKGFTRIIADEGVAVYDMLTGISYDGDEKYFDTIVKLTREQALKYPAYMAEQKSTTAELSASEMIVLKLAAEGKKNAEIAKFLFITENTVKFHMKNIFTKLQVNSRSKAVKVAQEIGLI